MKTKMAVLALLLAAAFGSTSALANDEHHKMNLDEMRADMTTIRQAANELRATNTGLSDKLAAIADKKDKKIAKIAEMKDEKTQQVAGLRQAAAELKGTNPNLAKQLEEWADKKEKHKADKEDDKN